jgi:hypothetical protein
VLDYWYPNNIATVINDSLELVSFVKHLALISFSVTIVFLNELNLCLCPHPMQVVYLLFKHLFS